MISSCQNNKRCPFIQRILRVHSKITSHPELTLQHILRRSTDGKILKIALLFLRFCHLRLGAIYVALSTHLCELIFECTLSIVSICGIFVLGISATGFAAEHVEVSGITEPVMSVTLSADQAGKLAKIFYKEGDHVKKGAVIIELEKTMEELEVERRRLILDSKVELNTAIEQEKTLKCMLDSTRTLFSKTKSVSKDEMDKLELDYKLAVGKRKQYEVAEKRELIEYNIARENLQRRILVAPVACIITDLLLDVGETCEPRQPLVKIVDPSKCFFTANMDERLGRTLKKGQIVKLKIRTGDTDIERDGKVVYIAPVVDSASNLLEVKVKFNNSKREIRPGVSGVMLVNFP